MASDIRRTFLINSSHPYDAEVTLVAITGWSSVNTYAIETYDSYIGGYRGSSYEEIALVPQGYTNDSYITAIERAGYVFIGWYTLPADATGNNQPTISAASVLVATGRKISISAAADSCKKWATSGHYICYAKFKLQEKYTVTFNANGGSVSPASAQSGPEIPVTLPLPNRSEFIFIGWYDSAEGGTLVGLNGDEYRATETITLYAHWRAERDYIVYDANGGESVSTSYVQVYVGSQIGTLPTASWGDAEYSFIGWFTQREGGTQIVSTTIVTDEMPRRLFAHWRDNKVTVTFDANGGLAPVSYLLVAGVSYGELPTAYKYGYSFEGWYSSSSLTDRVVSTSIVPAFDHTLYAKFEQSSGETYSIVFRDDVSGQTATVEAPVGQNFILPDASRGLGFVVPSGYATDPIRSWICMNTGAVYADRALVKDLAPSGETVVLTWVLVKNTVTITLDPNGGTLDTTTYQKRVGEQYGAFPEPSLDGKNFDGWYTEKTGGTKVSPTDTVIASVTLYARWSGGTFPWFEFIVS